jgi:dihydrofolate reductase
MIYSVIASLDGYVNDREGGFAWARPDDEVHAFVNDQERSVGTYLLGRRLYETMVVWETMDPGGEPVLEDFARIWRAADKVVYSRTLDTVAGERTRLERDFDPAVAAAIPGTVSVGGPGLAAQALRAGLVDECRVLIAPAVVGGGARWLPDDIGLALELLDERRFRSGFVALRYRVGR